MRDGGDEDMKLLRTVAEFIAHESLLQPADRCLVALSGGADSVALLLVLQRLGYVLEAAHCNFHLRGAESDRDEAFVRRLCQQFNVPLHVAHFDTQSYAQLHQVSIEMAARQLRYNYFDQLCHDLDMASVCVAHHQDDAVETLLMNLLRGSGIHGLTGIRPRNGRVVRPLLCVRRADLVRFLETCGQDYVTDSTNLEDDVQRNRIRHHLVPLLTELNPSATDNLLRTAHWLREAERVYNDAIARTLCDQSSMFSVQTLLDQPSPESILYEWLRPCGFPSSTAAEVLASLRCGRDATGTLWTSATHELLIDRGRLLLQACQPSLPVMRLPETGVYVYTEAIRFSLSCHDGSYIEKRPECACLDAALITFPLTVRPVAAGDRFHPLGMRGSRLVSDFLTDRKLSLFDRRRQLVLTDATGRILWLVNQRPDHRFRVTATTSRTLVVTLLAS